MEITVLLGIRTKRFLLLFLTQTLLQKQQLLVSLQLIKVMACRTGLGQGGSLCHFNQEQFSALSGNIFVWFGQTGVKQGEGGVLLVSL